MRQIKYMAVLATDNCQEKYMLNVITIIVSKMTSYCIGTVQMREESESGIRKWEEMRLKTTARRQREGEFPSFPPLLTLLWH